eukprot:749004-Hanusia_phi.AAC.4
MSYREQHGAPTPTPTPTPLPSSLSSPLLFLLPLTPGRSPRGRCWWISASVSSASSANLG